MTAKKPGSIKKRVAAAETPAVAGKPPAKEQRVAPSARKVATRVAEANSEKTAVKRPAAKSSKATAAAKVPRASVEGAAVNAATPDNHAPVSGAGEPATAPVVVPDATTPAPPAPVRSAISVDDIREAAFYLSQRRHGPSDPVADWLQAERLLLARAG